MAETEEKEARRQEGGSMDNVDDHKRRRRNRSRSRSRSPSSSSSSSSYSRDRYSKRSKKYKKRDKKRSRSKSKSRRKDDRHHRKRSSKDKKKSKKHHRDYKKKDKRYKSDDDSSSSSSGEDGPNVRRSAISGKKIKMQIDKTAEWVLLPCKCTHWNSYKWYLYYTHMIHLWFSYSYSRAWSTHGGTFPTLTT